MLKKPSKVKKRKIKLKLKKNIILIQAKHEIFIEKKLPPHSK